MQAADAAARVVGEPVTTARRPAAHRPVPHRDTGAAAALRRP